MSKNVWGIDARKIEPGKYSGITEFINKNKLRSAFKKALSDDRSVEDYAEEYSNEEGLSANILNCLFEREENEKHIDYPTDVNGFAVGEKFTWKP